MKEPRVLRKRFEPSSRLAPPIEKAQTKLITRMVDSFGVDPTMRILAKRAGFVSVPPTISQFITDKNYIGGSIKFFPKWKDALHTIYPNPFFSPYLEIGLSGGIGLGKTSVALAGTAYDMMKLQYLNDPQGYCGLARSTKIAFAMVNATADLAKAVLISQLDDWVENSPYFRPLKESAKGRTYLPKNIDIVAGSRFSHVLGMAVVGAVMSELNFQDKVKDQAYENYTNAITRLKSRFMPLYRKKGHYVGRIWLDSSKNDASSFMEAHLEKNMGVDKLLTVFDYPYWEVHRERMNYSGNEFKIFIGDSSRDPFILQHAHDIVGLDESLILDVPIEHKKEFDSNLPRSLRDIAGKGTWSTSKLIPTVEKLNQAMSRENPVKQEIIRLDFFDRSQRLLDYLMLDKIRNDRRPRYIHFDLGLRNDHTGIACTRIEGYIEIQKLNPKTGMLESFKEPRFVTEWVMAVAPTPGMDVPIYKLKEFIISLKGIGVPIAEITTDGYQSDNLRQDLKLVGFEVALQSVDRKKDVYEYLKDAILEGRWVGPYHPILMQELKDIEDTGKKYDHPKLSGNIMFGDGSKDLADCVSASVYRAFLGMSEFGDANNLKGYLDSVSKLTTNTTSVYDSIARSSNL